MENVARTVGHGDAHTVQIAATEVVPVRTKREAGTGGTGFSRPGEHSKQTHKRPIISL